MPQTAAATKSEATGSLRKVFAAANAGELKTAHRGLLLDKFAGLYGNPNQETAAVRDVCSRKWRQGQDALYPAAFARWEKLWSAREDCLHFRAQAGAPLAVGHGAKGILHGGIRLQHSYGLPLIPGSAIRGALSNYIHRALGSKDAQWLAGEIKNGKIVTPQGACHAFLFGNSEEAGRLMMQDAWWSPKDHFAPLRADVITPHHADYYAGEAPPLETDEPVPVAIPTLPPQAEFLFVLQIRHCENCENSRKWLEIAALLLRHCLRDHGLGAKTSQGYGRFILDEENITRQLRENAEKKRQEQLQREQAAAQQARLAGLDELSRELLELSGGAPYNIPLLVEKLTGTHWSGERRTAVAERLKEIMREGKKWNLTGKPEKDKYVKRSLGIQSILDAAAGKS